MKKYINLFLFVVMVIVNALAVTGVIGNIRTEDVSALYHSVLTPLNMTFSIWSVIYMALFALVIWQLTDKADKFREDFTAFFSISCVINILWIFCWQFKNIALSFVALFFLVAVLLMLMVNISEYNIWVKSVIGLYAGWTNIALYANLAALGRINSNLWAIILLSIAAAQISGIIYVSSTAAFSASAVWGLIGIGAANFSSNKLIFSVSIVYAVMLIIFQTVKYVKECRKCEIIN